MNIFEAIEIIDDFKAMDDWTAVYCPPMHEALDVVVNEALRKPKLTWIPCSKRLPKTLGCYLVWRPHFFSGKIGMPAICYFDGQDTWHDSYGVDFSRALNKKDVIAWMPLPKYEGIDG